MSDQKSIQTDIQGNLNTNGGFANTGKIQPHDAVERDKVIHGNEVITL